LDVVNQKNKLVPQSAKVYTNTKKGIYIEESHDDEIEDNGFWEEVKQITSKDKKTKYIEY
jgi:hypothetical protein